MAIVRWSPWRELEAMDRRMRRLFEDVGATPAAMPAADVYETDDEFVVELEAPGYEEEELEVEVLDSTLKVSGARSEEKEKKEKTFHYQERLEASFERRFALPAEVDTDAVGASFEKGVLVVRAKKAAEGKPRKVEIGKAS